MSAALRAFLYSFISGAAALALWDALHGLRRTFFRGFFGNLILDILWWCVAVTLFLSTVWSVSEWRIRFFEIAALIIGAALWRSSFSRPLRRLSEWIFGFLRKIFIFIFKILLTPARFSVKILTGYYGKKRTNR